MLLTSGNGGRKADRGVHARDAIPDKAATNDDFNIAIGGGKAFQL